MLNNQQIKLFQTAIRKAKIRTAGCDGRYRFLLSQYLQSNGEPVTSCKQLNQMQLEDMLALCEAQGWRMPGKPEDYYRSKIGKKYNIASFAQQAAIKHLAGDLGMDDIALGKFCKRMTGNIDSVAGLTPSAAWKITEALKSMLGRKAGKDFKDLSEITDYFNDGDAKDGQKNQTNQV